MRRILSVGALVLLAGCAFRSCTCGRSDELLDPGRSRAAAPTARVHKPRPRPQLAEPRLRLPTLRPAERPDLGDLEAAPPVADLPADFPADVPLYEGSEPFAVQDLAGDAHNVLFYVDAKQREVFEFYAEKMIDEGWKLSQQYQAHEQAFLSFKKGDMLANMTISRDPKSGRQVVGIMYQQEQPLPFEEF